MYLSYRAWSIIMVDYNLAKKLSRDIIIFFII